MCVKFLVVVCPQKARYTKANSESYRPCIYFIRQMKVLSRNNQFLNNVVPNLSVIIIDKEG